MALWNVPILSQSTLYLCWEACARMMWMWHYKNLKLYNKRAGNYLQRNIGLNELQMDLFYRQLGLRALQNPKGANIQHALTWTPVIFTETGQVTGHAIVAIGYNAGVYTIINPSAIQVVNFDGKGGATGSGTGGKVSLPESHVHKALGRYIWYW